MNKMKGLIALMAIATACCGQAYAGNAFTPLNFEDSNYTSSNSNPVIASTATTPVQQTSNTDLIGNTKMQSAISALDNAQVEVRNELLNYRTQYAEVDAKYIKIKSERAALSKQLKATEKRIKEIDRAKDKIKKNMM